MRNNIKEMGERLNERMEEMAERVEEQGDAVEELGQAGEELGEAVGEKIVAAVSTRFDDPPPRRTLTSRRPRCFLIAGTAPRDLP